MVLCSIPIVYDEACVQTYMYLISLLHKEKNFCTLVLPWDANISQVEILARII